MTKHNQKEPIPDETPYLTDTMLDRLFTYIALYVLKDTLSIGEKEKPVKMTVERVPRYYTYRVTIKKSKDGTVLLDGYIPPKIILSDDRYYRTTKDQVILYRYGVIKNICEGNIYSRAEYVDAKSRNLQSV